MLERLPFVYKMTVQQGNVITEEQVAQLQPGMTKRQVTYLLGTPLLTDFFNTDRWDYVYTIRRGHKPKESRKFTVFFQDDALVRTEGDLGLKPGPGRDGPAQGDRRLSAGLPGTPGIDRARTGRDRHRAQAVIGESALAGRSPALACLLRIGDQWTIDLGTVPICQGLIQTLDPTVNPDLIDRQIDLRAPGKHAGLLNRCTQGRPSADLQRA